MKTVIHKADSRGYANHGWLESYHTFSFAGYHNPERHRFGLLLVLNDDKVNPGEGFGKHPHDNMEIISIPLEGELKHKDSMGNETIIREGEVQVMSAGTGIFHSEFNNSDEHPVKFLQIWLYPDRKNVIPRYDQISLKDVEKENSFYQILSPNKDDQGVWIYQKAWFHLGKFTPGSSDTYALKQQGNGIYLFVLEGELDVNTQVLERRDGIGITDTNQITVKAISEAKVLLMEVPM